METKTIKNKMHWNYRFFTVSLRNIVSWHKLISYTGKCCWFFYILSYNLIPNSYFFIYSKITCLYARVAKRPRRASQNELEAATRLFLGSSPSPRFYFHNKKLLKTITLLIKMRNITINFQNNLFLLDNTMCCC